MTTLSIKKDKYICPLFIVFLLPFTVQMTATGEKSSSTSSSATATGTSSTQAMAISNTWWAAGHALFLVEALLYTLFPSLTIFYRLALLGLVASYATDVYRVYASAPVSKGGLVNDRA